MANLNMDVNVDTGAFEKSLEKVDMLSLYGIDKDRVGRITVELQRLRKSGLLVMVEVKGVSSMFVRRAEFSESGITKNDARVKRYTPGSKYLIPKEDVERLRSVEVRMREAVNKFSYGEIEGFKPYRWIPWTSYRAFRARWDQLLREFIAVKRDIISKYDAYRDDLAYEFSRSATKAWETIERQGYTALIYKGKGYLSEVEFVDAVVQDALDMFPSIEKIEAELTADYRVNLIDTDIDVDAAQEINKHSAEKAKHEAQEAYLKERLAQETFNHKFNMMRLERQEKEAEVDAMMRAEAEHAKAQLAEMKSPFEAVFTSLREQIAGDCQSILESIQKNGYVRGKVAEKARSLVELYDLLAIHGDDELRSRLSELRDKIGEVGAGDASLRDAVSVEATLEQIISLAHTAANDLEACRASFLE